MARWQIEAAQHFMLPSGSNGDGFATGRTDRAPHRQLRAMTGKLRDSGDGADRRQHVHEHRPNDPLGNSDLQAGNFRPSPMPATCMPSSIPSARRSTSSATLCSPGPRGSRPLQRRAPLAGGAPPRPRGSRSSEDIGCQPVRGPRQPVVIRPQRIAAMVLRTGEVQSVRRPQPEMRASRAACK